METEKSLNPILACLQEPLSFDTIWVPYLSKRGTVELTRNLLHHLRRYPLKWKEWQLWFFLHQGRSKEEAQVMMNQIQLTPTHLTTLIIQEFERRPSEFRILSSSDFTRSHELLALTPATKMTLHPLDRIFFRVNPRVNIDFITESFVSNLDTWLPDLDIRYHDDFYFELELLNPVHYLLSQPVDFEFQVRGRLSWQNTSQPQKRLTVWQNLCPHWTTLTEWSTLTNLPWSLFQNPLSLLLVQPLNPPQPQAQPLPPSLPQEDLAAQMIKPWPVAHFPDRVWCPYHANIKRWQPHVKRQQGSIFQTGSYYAWLVWFYHCWRQEGHDKNHQPSLIVIPQREGFTELVQSWPEAQLCWSTLPSSLASSSCSLWVVSASLLRVKKNRVLLASCSFYFTVFLVACPWTQSQCLRKWLSSLSITYLYMVSHSRYNPLHFFQFLTVFPQLREQTINGLFTTFQPRYTCFLPPTPLRIYLSYDQQIDYPQYVVAFQQTWMDKPNRLHFWRFWLEYEQSLLHTQEQKDTLIRYCHYRVPGDRYCFPLSVGPQEDLMVEDVEPQPFHGRCCVCQDKLWRPTRNQNCQHTFCRDCLVQTNRAQGYCPLCRQVFGPNFRAVNFINPKFSLLPFRNEQREIPLPGSTKTPYFTALQNYLTRCPPYLHPRLLVSCYEDNLALLTSLIPPDQKVFICKDRQDPQESWTQYDFIITTMERADFFFTSYLTPAMVHQLSSLGLPKKVCIKRPSISEIIVVDYSDQYKDQWDNLQNSTIPQTIFFPQNSVTEMQHLKKITRTQSTKTRYRKVAQHLGFTLLVN